MFPFYAWSESEFRNHSAGSMAYLGLLLGFLVVMAFYNFFLYLSFRSRSYLYYVIYIASFTIVQLGQQGVGQQFFFTDIDINWISNDGLLFGVELSGIFAIFFTRQFLDLKDRVPWLDKVFIVLVGLALLNLLNLVVFGYNNAAKITTLNTFLTDIGLIVAGVISCLQRYRPAYFYTIAWVLMLVGGIGQVLKIAGVIEPSLFTIWGQVTGGAIEVLLLSLALADRVKLLNEEKLLLEEQQKRAQQELLEVQKKNIETLDQKVQERTIDLEEKNRNIGSMLENLPQGILTIVPGMVIHHEYSKFLESIFEEEELAGKNAVDFIFSDSTISVDVLSQIRSTIFSSLGETLFNYELNDEILPTEITKVFGDEHKKYLEISWAPIVNNEDCVEKILVSIRDITTLKELEAASEEQRERLDLIGNLLSISKKDFEHFANSTLHYLDENSKILNLSEGNVNQKIDELFRNMHTVKGNARSLRFGELSEAAHIAEYRYEQIRKGELEITDLEVAIKELENTQHHFDIIKDINDNTLNRSKDQKDDLFVELLTDIEKELTKFEEEGSGGFSAVAGDIIGKINRISKSTVDSIILSVKESIGEIAERLDKEIPIIEVTGKDLYFSNDQEILIKDVFNHLMRNSIDHGIETRKERSEKNKLIQGKITIETTLESNFYTMRFFDDGKGINLDAIKQKAVESKMLDPSLNCTVEKIIECLFKPGFSTSDEVSDISGRGVGMDAAKTFLEQNGGSIDLKFFGSEIDSTACIPFYWEIKVPVAMGSIQEVA
ncbi:MAG: hypothetical protein CMP10_12720 [Zetaproteobacteria bacterium]|nr:hypothetical protein [Pseudobdellovibrionaceae bacterium]